MIASILFKSVVEFHLILIKKSLRRLIYSPRVFHYLSQMCD